MSQIVFFFILAFGFLIRLWHINFGLPWLITVDEDCFTNAAIEMIHHGDLNPHWFGHPGSTTIYLLYFLFSIFFSVGTVFRKFSDLHQFMELYDTSLTPFFIIGRSLMVFFSIASIIAVYKITKKFFGQEPALITSFFLSISPLHVEYSQIIRTDIMLAFFLLLTIYFSLSILKLGKTRYYLLAAISVAASITTKYTGVATLVPVIIASLLAKAKNKEKKILFFFLVLLSALFAFSPFLFLDYQQVINDLIIETQPLTFHERLPGIRNYFWYTAGPMDNSFGLGIKVIAFVSMLYFLIKRKKETVILNVFIISYIALIGSLHLKSLRWVIPVIAPLAILASLLIHEIIAKMLPTKKILLRNFLTAIVVAFLSIQPILSIIAYHSGKSKKHMTTQAKEWIEKNIPPKSNILIEHYAPLLSRKTYNIYLVAGGEISKDGYGFYWKGEIKNLMNPKSLEETKIEYLIISRAYRYFQREDRYFKEVKSYQEILNRATLIKEFIPTKNDSGPPTAIYKLNPN